MFHLMEKETEYKAAIDSHKICGDGEFTKRCNAWIEEHTGTAKALLTTSGTQALAAALLSDIQPGDEVILPSYTFLCPPRTRLCCAGQSWSLVGHPSGYHEHR